MGNTGLKDHTFCKTEKKRSEGEGPQSKQTQVGQAMGRRTCPNSREEADMEGSPGVACPPPPPCPLSDKEKQHSLR